MNKQQILDTFTAVCRLALLSFKPIGTKISIRDYRIFFSESPIPLLNHYTQGLERYLNGDSREDIYIINQVIINFIEIFVIPYKISNTAMYRRMIDIAKFLCVGLKQLQKTYCYGNVVCSLQYYIIVLFSIIGDTYDPSFLYRTKQSQQPDVFLESSDQKIFYDDDNSFSEKLNDIDDVSGNFSTIKKMRNTNNYNDQFNDNNSNSNSNSNSNKNTTNNINNNLNNSTIIDKSKIKNISSEEELINIHQLFCDCFYPIKSSTSNILPTPKNITDPIIKIKVDYLIKLLDNIDDKFFSLLSRSLEGSK